MAIHWRAVKNSLRGTLVNIVLYSFIKKSTDDSVFCRYPIGNTRVRVQFQLSSVWRQHGDVQHVKFQHGDVQHEDVQYGEMQHGDVQHGEVQSTVWILNKLYKCSRNPIFIFVIPGIWFLKKVLNCFSVHSVKFVNILVICSYGIRKETFMCLKEAKKILGLYPIRWTMLHVVTIPTDDS
jgi:hypothetical protein